MLNRRGMTLAEVLVAVGIVAILSAVTIPTVRGRLRDGRAQAMVQELDGLKTAVLAYRHDVGKSPPNLSYLLGPLTLNTSVDGCSNKLTQYEINNFRGPYIERSTLATGYTLADNEMVEPAFNTTTSGNLTNLQITIDNVDFETAQDVDLMIDGSTSGATPNSGTITYDQGAAGAQTQMIFWIPIPLNAC